MHDEASGTFTVNAANHDSELFRTTIQEVRPDRQVASSHVRDRLQDWQTRTSQLYDFMERSLGQDYKYDRSGKQRSAEDLVQRAHLTKDDVPALDILRIESSNGVLRAIVIPRSLWIIGANGRLDMRILEPESGRQRQYFLVDKSMPLSGADTASWYLIDPLDRLAQWPLTEQRLRDLIERPTVADRRA